MPLPLPRFCIRTVILSVNVPHKIFLHPFQLGERHFMSIITDKKENRITSHTNSVLFNPIYYQSPLEIYCNNVVYCRTVWLFSIQPWTIKHFTLILQSPPFVLPVGKLNRLHTNRTYNFFNPTAAWHNFLTERTPIRKNFMDFLWWLI